MSRAVWTLTMAMLLSLAGGLVARADRADGSREPAGDGGPWQPLFNGRNFEGWTATLQNGDLAIEDVWSIKAGGVLHCKGKPKGVLRTKQTYSDYILELEWRWPGEGGNNGVLVHAGESKALGIWPRSLEVQLEHHNAGDFWDIALESDMPDEEARRDGRNIKRLEKGDVEKPRGQWNHVRIRCEDDTVTVRVNGTKVNYAKNLTSKKTGEPRTEGAICLQSEGTPIEYRHIRLKSIE